MQSEKPFYKSKTVMSALATVIVALAGAFGLDLDAGNVTEIVMSISGAAGGVIAIVGRMYGKDTVSGPGKKTAVAGALAVLLPLGACSSAQSMRKTPNQSSQRANDQTNVTINAQGNNRFDFGERPKGATTRPSEAKMSDSITVTNKNSGQTADGSIQGDSTQDASQSGDASGDTEQEPTSETTPKTDLKVTPGG